MQRLGLGVKVVWVTLASLRPLALCMEFSWVAANQQTDGAQSEREGVADAVPVLKLAKVAQAPGRTTFCLMNLPVLFSRARAPSKHAVDARLGQPGA